MSEVMNRILVAAGLALVVVVAAWLEFLGIHAVYWLCIIIGLAMIGEFVCRLWTAPRAVMFNTNNLVLFALFLGLLGVDFVSLLTLGHRPMLLLFVLCVICAADICAWLFGRMIGGDKMWERISEHKTWAGQIFGVIGGTAVAVLYGFLTLHAFAPQLLWIGISVSLLSQYGDLTASFIKRRLKIKDFSRVLGAHGGIIDRVDGWIYVLPLIWMILA
ncbi:MAG: CDP-archaeol synthase [Alphaproteobacteria bacterium]|nr:CDP-archaeol synthase [Alphaproteobacteria bacterium]